MSEMQEELECLDRHQEGHVCTGPVKHRESLSGTGTPIARCDAAWEQSLKRHEEIRERYPDSDTPPGWFDPTYAGESWDETW